MSDLNELLDKWNQEMQKEFSPDPQTIIRLGDQILLADRIILALEKENADLRAKLETAEKEVDKVRDKWFEKYQQSASQESVLFGKLLEVKQERDNLQETLTKYVKTHSLSDEAVELIKGDLGKEIEQLQAQCAAMRQALEDIVDWHMSPCTDNGLILLDNLLGNAKQALSTNVGAEMLKRVKDGADNA